MIDRSLFPALLFVGLVFNADAATVSVQHKLRAVASEEISGPLIVDEKGLRKLSELIRSRMNEKSDLHRIEYRVQFTNNFYYETDDLTSILSEENSRSRRIVGLQIRSRTLPPVQYSGPLTPEQRLNLEEALLELQGLENPQIEVSLSELGANYSVTGADRDWVLNTQVDLSERLRNFSGPGEMLRKMAAPTAAGIGFLGTFVPFAIRFRKRYDNRKSRDNPSHLRTPLSRYIFAIHDPDLSMLQAFLPFQLALVVGALLWFLADRLMRHLYPQLVFLIGEEARRYEGILAMRSYVVSGVIAAFVIGLLASVLANLMTRKR